MLKTLKYSVITIIQYFISESYTYGKMMLDEEIKVINKNIDYFGPTIL